MSRGCRSFPGERPMTFRPTAGILAIAAGLMGVAPAAAQQGPAMAATHLPAEVITLACAPRVVYEAPMTPLRVTGGQDAVLRLGFAPGNLVTINAGSQNGISVGQEF